MLKEEIHSHIGFKNINIVTAMKQIDLNGHGVLFIVNESGKLAGCLTDGDIRRWLIRTGRLDVEVAFAMNDNPLYLYEDNKHQALKYMKQKAVAAMPIINDNDEIIDIVLDDVGLALSPSPKKDMIKDIPVIIMAGGKGTRLYPYTKILPKPLIPIGEIPIVERIIEKFCEFGISSFYMTVNYKKEMIKSYFAELAPKYHIEYVEENKPLGTAGSIKLIKNEFTSPVIITNCDILINANYSDIISYHRESGNVLTIVSALKDTVVPYGVLHLGAHGIVESIEEKPQISYMINTGMYVLDPHFVNIIPENVCFHMTDLTEALLEKGEKVGMYPISEDSFLDMGEFEEMKRMEKKLNTK